MRKLDFVKSAIVAAVVAVVGVVAFPAMEVSAAWNISSGIEEAKPDDAGNTTLEDWVGNIINVVLFVLGLIAVAFIIYGGVKYATSAGDAAKVTSAKNTIMYAVIGLIVAILAYAIVSFVVRGIKNE